MCVRKRGGGGERQVRREGREGRRGGGRRERGRERDMRHDKAAQLPKLTW